MRRVLEVIVQTYWRARATHMPSPWTAFKRGCSALPSSQPPAQIDSVAARRSGRRRISRNVTSAPARDAALSYQPTSNAVIDKGCRISSAVFVQPFQAERTSTTFRRTDYGHHQSGRDHRTFHQRPRPQGANPAVHPRLQGGDDERG